MRTRRFIKIYRELPNEYPAVYDDAETLGTYVQLLMLVDGMYPMHPQLPRNVSEDALERLTTAGLVSTEPGDRFTVKGYEKQREAESEQGRRDAAKRWSKQADGYPIRDPDGTPHATRPDQTRQDQTRPSRAPAREDAARAGSENGTSPNLRVSTDVQRLGEYINGADCTATFSSLKEHIGMDADGHFVAVTAEET